LCRAKKTGTVPFFTHAVPFFTCAMPFFHQCKWGFSSVYKYVLNS
jgi:hypothetical protein